MSVEAVPTITNTSAPFKVIGSPASASHGAGATLGRSRANQTQQVNFKINFTQDAGAISNKTARVRLAIIGSNGAVIINKTGNLTYQNSTSIRLRNRTAAGGAPPIWEINYTFNATITAPGNFTFIVNASNSVGNSVKRKFNFTLKDVTKPSVISLIESPTGAAGSMTEIRLKVEDVKGGSVSIVYVNLSSRGIAISPKRINLSTNDNKNNGTWAANFTLPINTTAPVTFLVYTNDSRGYNGRIGNISYNINKSFAFNISLNICGDVNRDLRVDILDALLVARYTSGLQPLTLNQIYCADVNYLGAYITDILDALIIARKTVGKPVTLNCGPLC